jgi:peptide/nickel transport system permease protein
MTSAVVEVAVATGAPSVGRRSARDYVALVAVGIVAVSFALAVLAPWLPLPDPNEGELGHRLAPPGTVLDGRIAWLGTDQLGRDLLSRVIWGSRSSLLVGFCAVVLAGTIGTAIGLFGGYYGGRIDRVVTFVTDAQMSFPFLCLAVVLVAVLGRGLVNLIVALGLGGWVLYTRVARGEVLKAKQLDFVQAMRALGATAGRIMWRGILPNFASPLIVVATFSFGQMIVLEASLNFLGLGLPPRIPTWGGMLADAYQYMRTSWWLPLICSAPLTLLVIAVNTLGDWLRDRLDPHLQT